MPAMNRILVTLAIAPALALTACSQDAPADARAISTSEAEALDEAAEMLEERRLPPDIFEESVASQPTETSGEESQP